MGTVEGTCAPGWEGVRDAFATNIDGGSEVGAAYSVHHDGRLVVDLWGGTYRPDTLQLVFSTTKGWTATLANLLVERGLLDLDAPVASYWPEFGAEDKGSIPVRWLLTHQAGLPFPSLPVTYEDVLSWDRIVDKLAASTTEWEPGTAHGYHAVTYGFLVGEVLRRVTGRTVGTLLAEEVAGPLGLDTYIGLPDGLGPRVEPLAGRLGAPDDADPAVRELIEQFMGPTTRLGRALSCGGALSDSAVFNDPEVWAAEIPAANGITDARSLSRLYAALIGPVEADDRFPAGKRILDEQTVRAASTPMTSGADLCLVMDTTFGLGFMTSSPFSPYGGPAGFGHAGAGGSVGFADPEHGIGAGYVMSRMNLNLSGDPRSQGLIRATYDAIGIDPTFV